MAIKRPITKKATQEPEPEDEPAPKKSLKKKSTEPEPEPEPEDDPKPKKKSKKSLSDLFEETKPGGGLFPTGNFKARIILLELEGEIEDDPDDQAELKVKVTFEGHEEEEDVAGKTISNWYNIADEDGNIGPGVPFFKRDMDILGYDEIALADIPELCDEVTKDKPEVNIKVVENKGYTNAFLQSLAD